MSQLFEHKGAGGKGYSQPEPIASPENIQIPSTLVRSHLPRWPRSQNQRWFAITLGYLAETSESIPDFIHLVPAL